MQPPISLRKWTRLAVSACLLAGAGLAQAQTMTPAPSPPPGWVWQGMWQDGRWTGQWVPGAPGGPGPMPQGAYAPPMADPEMQRMAARCRDNRHAHGHDCTMFLRDHPEFAAGYGTPGQPYAPQPYANMPYAPMPYGAPSYGPMPQGAYAPPMGWMMVPVVQGPQAPCVETKTVTTEYVTERRHRVIRAQPHRKEKRVYTGS